jgi:hypothetical protein
MNIESVESTTLAAIGYDDIREILQLEFLSHAVYLYFGVPGSVYEALVAAPSKGRYFNGAIRGHFPHALISGTSSSQGGEA